jgi:hypothetical protein
MLVIEERRVEVTAPFEIPPFPPTKAAILFAAEVEELFGPLGVVNALALRHAKAAAVESRSDPLLGESCFFECF